MIDQLPSLFSRGSEAEPIHYIVQAAFQEAQQRIARDPRLPFRSLKNASKLAFLETINSLQFLLLTQLQTVIGRPLTGLTMLPRGITPALDRAFLGHTTRPLQKELLALSPTQAADRSTIFCHATTPPLPQQLKYDRIRNYIILKRPGPLLHTPTLRRSTSVVRNRGDVTDQIDAQTCTLQ